MTDQKINNVLSGVVDMLEEMGYKVVYVALYGSQNYNLETPQSDLDFKSMVVPTLDDIVPPVHFSCFEEINRRIV